MTENPGHQVLIVGCGQLGSRHLQAIASLPQVREVEVVDPRPEALSLGQERLTEIPDCQPSISFRWLSSLEQAASGGNLCIVATQAPGRCQLVREVTEKLGYTTFLLEKLVGQSVTEVEELLQFTTARNLKIWVNCPARAYAIHRRVKERLDPADPVTLNVSGGNFGLANNGIHHADLFAFFDGSGRIESGGSRIDPTLHNSKRSEALFDLSGTIQGCTEKGGRLIITYSPDHANWEHLTIATQGYRCVVDHLRQTAFESDANSGWTWQSVPFQESILISQLTQEFASDILASGKCNLPTLEDSLVSHRFILGELQPHFSRLLNRDLELCPVT